MMLEETIPPEDVPKMVWNSDTDSRPRHVLRPIDPPTSERWDNIVN